MKELIYMLLFMLLVFIAIPLGGQNLQYEKLPSKHLNLLAIEGGGHGFIYSFNYERTFINTERFKTAAQIGISYYGKQGGVIPFWMPITINQMIKTIDGEYIEIGFGKMLNDDGVLYADGNFISNYKWDDWIFRLGYRFQSNDNRTVLRISYTPIYQDKFDLIHWGGVSFGYRM